MMIGVPPLNQLTGQSSDTVDVCMVGFELIEDRYNPRPTSAYSVGSSAETREVETFQTISAFYMCRTEHVPAGAL